MCQDMTPTKEAHKEVMVRLEALQKAVQDLALYAGGLDGKICNAVHIYYIESLLHLTDGIGPGMEHIASVTDVLFEKSTLPEDITYWEETKKRWMTLADGIEIEKLIQSTRGDGG